MGSGGEDAEAKDALIEYEYEDEIEVDGDAEGRRRRRATARRRVPRGGAGETGGAAGGCDVPGETAAGRVRVPRSRAGESPGGWSRGGESPGAGPEAVSHWSCGRGHSRRSEGWLGQTRTYSSGAGSGSGTSSPPRGEDEGGGDRR